MCRRMCVWVCIIYVYVLVYVCLCNMLHSHTYVHHWCVCVCYVSKSTNYPIIIIIIIIILFCSILFYPITILWCCDINILNISFSLLNVLLFIYKYIRKNIFTKRIINKQDKEDVKYYFVDDVFDVDGEDDTVNVDKSIIIIIIATKIMLITSEIFLFLLLFK